MQIDVKSSSVTGGGFSFYITDKNTSNFFVKLGINMSTNPLINRYVVLENASDYELILKCRKPNGELISVEGQLMNEQNALYQFNLTQEQKDIVGVYLCEYWIKSKVNEEEEITTTESFEFTVYPSILNSFDNVVEDPEQYPLLQEIYDEIEEIRNGNIEIDLEDYARKEYVDEAIESVDVTEQLADYAKKDEISTKTAYGTCSTEADVAEKQVVVDNPKWKLEPGSIVTIKHSESNKASNVTINVNGTGAYPIWYNTGEYDGNSASACGSANVCTTYLFSGTHWVWVSRGNYASYSNASLGHGYGTCTTAEATLAKACTISSYTLTTGGSVSVKFTNAVPANSTLNIRTRGAKKIFYKGAAITDGVIKAGDTATFVYDGTQYQLISIDRDYSSEINSLRNEITAGINEIADLLGGDA